MGKTKEQSKKYTQQYQQYIEAYKEHEDCTAKVKRMLLKYADEGNPIAIRSLAECYEEGDGVEKDEKKAKELYREAFFKFKPLAEKEEHPFIQYCLGRCYVEGNGTRKNHKKAVEWFQKSVDNGGRPFALFDLGLCYLHGLGVEKDEKKAVDLITQGVDGLDV